VEDPFAVRVVGGAFLAAALMLWGGWALLHRRIGMFFVPDDFARVGARLHAWLWLYRVHLFGMVTSALAVMALAALLADRPARLLVWPGAAVAVAGFIVGAAGSAFYYHFGVWGAMETKGKPQPAASELVAALRLPTHYVTCLVRFGRVFSGLGLLVLAVGLLLWPVLPLWLGWFAAAVGLAVMAVTMLFPDNWTLYTPIFHLQAMWQAATGLPLLASAGSA
jgi:hypothetical protein